MSNIRYGSKLLKEEKLRIDQVIYKNEKAFQWLPNEIGKTHLVEHEIPTGNAAPIVQRQYQIPSVARNSMLEQTSDMLKKNFILHSKSNWRSPVLLVKKVTPDGSIKYRFCKDLKKVNSVTTKDCYAWNFNSNSLSFHYN